MISIALVSRWSFSRKTQVPRFASNDKHFEDPPAIQECWGTYGDSLSFPVNGREVAKYVLGIRCTAVEEFSRGFIRSGLGAKEAERDQLVGAVTERKRPCKGVARENNICEEEVYGD